MDNALLNLYHNITCKPPNFLILHAVVKYWHHWNPHNFPYLMVYMHHYLISQKSGCKKIHKWISMYRNNCPLFRVLRIHCIYYTQLEPRKSTQWLPGETLSGRWVAAGRDGSNFHTSQNTSFLFWSRGGATGNVTHFLLQWISLTREEYTTWYCSHFLRSSVWCLDGQLTAN